MHMHDSAACICIILCVEPAVNTILSWKSYCSLQGVCVTYVHCESSMHCAYVEICIYVKSCMYTQFMQLLDGANFSLPPCIYAYAEKKIYTIYAAPWWCSFQPATMHLCICRDRYTYHLWSSLMVLVSAFHHASMKDMHMIYAATWLY